MIINEKGGLEHTGLMTHSCTRMYWTITYRTDYDFRNCFVFHNKLIDVAWRNKRPFRTDKKQQMVVVVLLIIHV